MIRDFKKVPVESGGGGFDSGEAGAFIKIVSATLSPAIVAANTSAEQSFTFTGVAAGDVVLRIEKPTHQAGLTVLGGRVTADNTVSVKFGNHTAAGITPTASEVYKLVALRMN